MNRVKTEVGREITFPVATLGGWLMSRETGADARTALEKALQAAEAGSVAVIDFQSVNAMTYSFVDEFLGAFLALRDNEVVPAVGVVVTGLNPDTQETVELVLERRGGQAVVYRTNVDSRLLCREEHLVSTYEIAGMLSDFKASQLAEQLSITPQNANNRLKKLTGAGALHRRRFSAERGGKEFTYRVVR